MILQALKDPNGWCLFIGDRSPPDTTLGRGLLQDQAIKTLKAWRVKCIWVNVRTSRAAKGATEYRGLRFDRTEVVILATYLIVIVARWDTAVRSDAAIVLLATALIETSDEGVFVVDVHSVGAVVDATVVSIDQRQCLGLVPARQSSMQPSQASSEASKHAPSHSK